MCLRSETPRFHPIAALIDRLRSCDNRGSEIIHIAKRNNVRRHKEIAYGRAVSSGPCG